MKVSGLSGVAACSACDQPTIIAATEPDSLSPSHQPQTLTLPLLPPKQLEDTWHQLVTNVEVVSREFWFSTSVLQDDGFARVPTYSDAAANFTVSLEGPYDITLEMLSFPDQCTFLESYTPPLPSPTYYGLRFDCQVAASEGVVSANFSASDGGGWGLLTGQVCCADVRCRLMQPTLCCGSRPAPLVFSFQVVCGKAHSPFKL